MLSFLLRSKRADPGHVKPLRALSAVMHAALLAPALACAAAPPQSVTAGYDVYMNGVHIAVMNETFETRDGEYRLVSESRAVGLASLFRRETVRFVSSGRLTPAGLQPLRFEGKRSDTDPRRVRGEFDWRAGRLTLEHGGRTENLPLPRGAQDRLSAMYQFMFLAPGKTLDIAMTNGRKLGQYQYTVQPGVEVDTPLGRMATMHVVKQHRPDESGTEIWISPQHRNLPVKMLVLEEDGARYEQVITRLEIKP
jgi:hypothetical protein